MIKINSPILNSRFKMIRVQCRSFDTPEMIKDKLMDLMNGYLQDNDGKLINVKVIQNNQICIYFVTGVELDDTNWEKVLATTVLSNYTMLPNIVEIRSSR